MHSGSLINDLFAVVERMQIIAHPTPTGSAKPEGYPVVASGNALDGKADCVLDEAKAQTILAAVWFERG